jgi:flagellar basal body-associated protein FliL
VNYVDARIEFQRASEAALRALRYEKKEQLRSALRRYWLAQKRLRVAKAAFIATR